MYIIPKKKEEEIHQFFAGTCDHFNFSNLATACRSTNHNQVPLFGFQVDVGQSKPRLCLKQNNCLRFVENYN